jgi:hypothetical protein
MVSKPLGWPGGLAKLFNLEGVANPVESQLSTAFEYASFANYWSTFLTGAAYLCGMKEGPRVFTARFWAVRGEVI